MPGHLFEGNPVDEGTTRRGTATPVHRPQRPAGSTHSLAQHKKKPEIPVVTRESRHNLRKTTCFQRLRKMRPLPATASQVKSHVPS